MANDSLWFGIAFGETPMKEEVKLYAVFGIKK
jgi:hypothetical protein